MLFIVNWRVKGKDLVVLRLLELDFMLVSLNLAEPNYFSVWNLAWVDDVTDGDGILGNWLALDVAWFSL